MSAIWGAVNLKKKSLNISLQTQMEEPFHQYKIDRYHSHTHENVMMGCGIQHITKESHHEILPIFDYEHNIFFTADCLLDNRDELLAALSHKYDYNNKTPDGTLIYGAYLMWGEDCAKHLRGLFAFAIYDMVHHKLLIYADQVAERCIYYHSNENNVYFSTLLAPIVTLLKDTISLNEAFLSDSLSLYGLRVGIDSASTFYENIFKVDAGCYLRITPNGHEIIRYWSPKSNKDIPPYESPEKSGAYCKYLMELAVKDALRCDGDVGGTLSSGLDSSTVCGIAASQLNHKNKILKTYTFVPLPDYEFIGSELSVPDETEGVKLIADMHPNIHPKFLENTGADAYSKLDYFLKTLESPVKSIGNLLGTMSLFQAAKKDNCKVVLIAQNGNLTISQGKIANALYDTTSKLNFIETYKIVTEFCTRYHASKKRVLIDTFKSSLKYPIDKIKYRLFENILDKAYVNPYFAKKMGSIKKIRKSYFNIQAPTYSTINHYHKYMYDLYSLSHIGEFNTKCGLANGILIRDPAKDIRVIEYCSSLPMECFFHNGLERWLVRGNMKQYVPESILKDVPHRGLQSADCLFRLNKRWPTIKSEMKALCLTQSLSEYVNTEMILDFFDKTDKQLDEDNPHAIDPLLYITAISKFINAI